MSALEQRTLPGAFRPRLESYVAVSFFSHCRRHRFSSTRPHASAGLRIESRLEITMPVSDILLECSRECARLSRDCDDEKIALALFQVSARLLAAAARDSELIVEDVHAAPSSDLHFGFPDEG